MKPPLREFVKNGYLQLPEGPGWGIELDGNEIGEHPYVETWLTRRKTGSS